MIGTDEGRIARMPADRQARSIDELMDKASAALVGTDYFEAERLCLRALGSAHAARDYERAARICMPLLESRRQKRLIAEGSGRVVVVAQDPPATLPREPACYLFQPPLIAAEARAFRERADRKRVACFVLCREPMTRAGLWPIAAVGASRLIGGLTLRAQVAPPAGVVFTGLGPTRDNASAPPSVEWFCAAGEAVGDAAIARINPRLPAAFRVEHLLAALDALPDHERLHQRLEEACRAAAIEPPPVTTLPREWAELDYQ